MNFMDLQDVKESIRIHTILDCIGVNDSSHGPEMHGKVFIGGFPGFCEL